MAAEETPWCGARERRVLDEAGGRQRQTGHRVDARHLQGHRPREVGQQPGEPGRQHGLARARWTHQQEMVAPGRRHLECSPGEPLPAYIGQVGSPLEPRPPPPAAVLPAVRPGAVDPPGFPSATGGHPPLLLMRQPRHQSGQGGGRQEVGPTGQAGLVGALRGNDQSEPAQRIGQRHHAGDPPHGSVQAQLADEGQPLDQGGVDHLRGHQHPDGDGQVESGAPLAHAGRRQVDRDPAERPRQAAGQQCRPDPVAGLAHRRVRQSDHGEAGKPVGHVDLDGDRLAVDADEHGRGNGGDHGALRSMRSGIVARGAERCRRKKEGRAARHVHRWVPTASRGHCERA